MTIPIVLSVDVEPDELFLAEGAPVTWVGFERAVTVLAVLRRRVAGEAGSARFSWKLRMDAQIAAVTGSAAWVVEAHGGTIAALAAAGDDLGVHIHPFRRVADTWIVDYADDAWVARCVAGSVDAFTAALGRPPRTASMGHNWQSDATVAQMGLLGIVADLSVEHGTHKPPFRDGPTRFLGERPSYESVPGHPYRPAASDFRRPGDPGGPAPWMLPLASLPGSPRVKYRIGFDDLDPDRLVADHPGGVVMAVRSDAFLAQGERIVADLERILAVPGTTLMPATAAIPSGVAASG